MEKQKPRVRLLGAVVNLALAVDRGDGQDLEPLNLDPIQLDAKAFREFASDRLDTAIAELEGKLDCPYA